MVKNTPNLLATKRSNDSASTIALSAFSWCFQGATMGMESDPALLQDHYESSMDITAVQHYGDRRRSTHRTDIAVPSQVWMFSCLPRHAHDERVSYLQSDFYARRTIQFDTSDLGLINCETTVHVDTIWTIEATATTTINRYNKNERSPSRKYD